MLHLLKYRFRLMIRNRVLLFWTLIFPMLLTTFFGMVLKDAYTVDTFQTVPIAVVEQKDLSQLKAVLKDVRQGDTALFKVSYVGEEQAKQLDVILVPYECAEGMKETKTLLEKIWPGQSVGIFIGPEGGFEEAEIEQALAAGAHTITLGKRILRTETAGLTTLSVLMFHLEE